MALPRLHQGQQIWIENTKTEHEHGGSGWEFGDCLWSPTLARPNPNTGRRADRYRSMRQVTPGDIILHFLEHAWGRTPEVALCGYSFAASSYQEVTTAPPKPGEWSGRPSYYRIALRGFTAIDPILLIANFKAKYRTEILAEKSAGVPTNYPFSDYPDGSLRLTQGNYLATCTQTLYAYLAGETAGGTKEEAKSPEANLRKTEYEEGQRRTREATFFIRNRKLAQAVKSAANYRCAVCDLHFPERYIGLGAQFIECHHLDPLSDRPGNDSSSGLTRLDRCVALCSNCHSMAHQRRPPYAVAELKAILQEPTAKLNSN